MSAPSPVVVKSRVYRMRSSQRIVGVILVISGLFITFAFWRGVLLGQRDANFVELFFPIVYLLFALLITIRAYRNAVLLNPGAVELRSLSGRRTLPINRIQGRRRYLSRGYGKSPDVWHIVLVPDDDRYAKLDIEELYNFDGVFNGWLSSLPNLDELDQKTSKSNFGLV